MKQKSFLRLLRFSITASIILTLIAFIFNIGIASANDVDTITIQGASVRGDYTLDTARQISGDIHTNWNIFYYDSASTNHIVDFKVILQPTWSATNQTNSTAFTITSGGSGTGYLSYDNRFTNASEFALYYFFDNNALFTSSPVTLTLDKNILTNIQLVGTSYCSSGTLSSSSPVGLSSGGAGPCAGLPITSAVIYSMVNVGSITNNTYNVTYFNNSQGFIIEVTKETIGTKVQLYDDLGNIYFTEPNFNTNTTNYLNNSNRGLTINITTADGAQAIQVINHTPGFVAANVPSDNVKNGVGIVWEFNTYNLDETGNVSWSKTTPLFACDNIKIYNRFDELISTLENPPDNGFYKLNLNETGTWKADYNRKSFCVSSEETLNTASTTVSQPAASYLIINATTIAGRQENVTYMSGRVSPFNPYLVVLDTQGQPEGKFSISGYSINTEGVSPVVITTSGQHTIRICDDWGCDPAVAVTNTVFQASIPTMNITQSNITMDNTVYSFEDTAIITYAIDNFNFSNKAILITSYNWDFGVDQTRYTGFTNQTGSLQEILSLFLGKYVYTGQYSMRLVGRNDSGDFILAFWNFSISDIDAEGYMLKMSKNKLCIGESNTFVVLSPTTSYLNITLNTNGNVFNSYYINMNKTISYKPAYTGTYSVILYSPEGYTKRSYTFDVDSCVISTPASTPSGTKRATQLAGLLDTDIFWALIFTVGLMIAVAFASRKKGEE